MRQEGEPSVDQILRSIKKVMARESERPPVQTGAFPAALEPTPAPEPEPVTQTRLADTPPDDLRPEPADADEAEEVRALAEEPRLAEAELVEPADDDLPADDMPDDLIEDEADGEAAIGGEAEAAPEPAAAAATPLTSAATGEALRRSLAALAMLADPNAPIPNGGTGEAALDGIVRDLLLPMLSQWLETHLPPIVERAVRDEIARITGGPSNGAMA